MGMYSKIKNPKTGRNVSIYSKLGKNILKKYLNNFKGGEDNATCEELKKRTCKSYSINNNCMIENRNVTGKHVNKHHHKLVSKRCGPIDSLTHIVDCANVKDKGCVNRKGLIWNEKDSDENEYASDLEKILDNASNQKKIMEDSKKRDAEIVSIDDGFTWQPKLSHRGEATGAFVNLVGDNLQLANIEDDLKWTDMKYNSNQESDTNQR